MYCRNGRSAEIVKANPERVFHHIGDRGKRESYRAAIEACKCDGFDMVVDFCCYDEGDAEVAAEALKGFAVGLYVYISTDSVYDAS